MRMFILSTVVAVTAAVSFAAPAAAGGVSFGFGDGNGYITVGGYDNHSGHGYGHHQKKRYYNDDYAYDYQYEPTCFIKKIKKWDKWGNLHIKKIKVCE